MKRELGKYLGKLIGRRNVLRLTGATAGSLIGFFILMAALQLWFDARWFMEHDEDDLFVPGIVVINKKVSLLSTFGFSDNTFSADELQYIREQPFVNRAEPFVPCRFRVSVSIDMSGMQIPNLASEFFFESVPDDLVDIPDQLWHWQPGNSFVPVVLPADFLKFYNFGFAPGQNLPQLSEQSLRKANLRLRISGSGKELQAHGKIVGLSEKINAILVPESFMIWANDNYGDQKSLRPTRLVLVSKVTADPDLALFIRERNYETNESELRSGKLNQLLQISLLVTGLVGLIIILLALYLFVLSFSLFIVRSDYEIRTLIQLGVPPGLIIGYLFRMLLLVVAIIMMINSAALHLAHKAAYNSLIEKGIALMPNISGYTFLIAAIVVLLLLTVNLINIRRNIFRIS